MGAKRINVELIAKDNPAYALLTELRNAYHEHLTGASIALAWRKSVKPDVDGRLVLGRCQKTSDLQREVSPYDFVILLNQEVWNSTDFTDAQRRALLDHELSHCEASLDKDGEPKLDDRDRVVWRIRKHDVEEFRAIVERHGCYKADLESFAQTIINKIRSTDQRATE